MTAATLLAERTAPPPVLPAILPSRPLVEDCVLEAVGTPSRSPLPAREIVPVEVVRSVRRPASTGTPPRVYFPAAKVVAVPRFAPQLGPLSARPQLTLLDAVREWAAYFDQEDA
jgi:hypothetical protein